MKTKILVHNKDFRTLGIELLPLTNLIGGPDIPHRDDYYIFVLQQKGESVWTIDFTEWKLEQVSACFVAPGQVHQYLKSVNAEGWLFFVEPKLIPSEYRMMLDTFTQYHQLIHIHKHHPVFDLTALLYRLIMEFENVLYQSILHSYINTLTGLLTSVFIPQHQPHIKTSSHKYQLVIDFKNLIAAQFKEIKQVKEYAARLNITPLYLNEVSKEVTGFIASYWIQKEIVLEAQRLLFYTGMDIKEIAFALGYEDHTYFSRFFKKNSGMTASEFRENNHYLSNHKHE